LVLARVPKRGLAAALALAFVGVSFPFSTQPAAACSTAEEQIFAEDSAPYAYYGTRNILYITNRTLNSLCTAIETSEAHSTAHMSSPSRDRQVEAGWVERWMPNFTHGFNAFWEAQIGEAFTGGFDASGIIWFACCPTSRFKLLNVPGTTYYKFYFDYDNNGSYVQLGPSGGATAGFSMGFPNGETSRRGGTATSAGDHQISLLKATSNSGSGTWVSWLDNYLRQDSLSNYHRVRVSDTEYKVIHD
jgi:hypothetical protein